MAGTQNELNKSHKELNSLHQMMQTYQKQPKFGDSKKFQKDIQRAEMNVKHLEDRMTSLKAEHAQVERSLEELKQRFSPRPPGGGNSSFNRGPSQTSSGGSIASSSETSSNQGIYDIPSVPHYDIGYVDDTDDNIPPPPPPPPMPGIGGMSISKYLNTSYLTDSYIVFILKMEYKTQNTIFGLKRMVKSGLEKFILKSLHAGR